MSKLFGKPAWARERDAVVQNPRLAGKELEEFKIKSESFVESVAKACAQIDPTGSSRLVREWQERQQGQRPDPPVSVDH